MKQLGLNKYSALRFKKIRNVHHEAGAYANDVNEETTPHMPVFEAASLK